MADTETIAVQKELPPSVLGRHLVGSQVFKALFVDGMNLVEETASYLDGQGKADSSGLSRVGTLAYATESMRLTSRLMQLASWLLLNRALNEGEISATRAEVEKSKIKLSGFASATKGSGWDDLPDRLRDLIERSTRLQARIRRLDGAMQHDGMAEEVRNPVARQRARIVEAFAAG